MNLATVRDDLKTRLATVSGLAAYDTVPAKPEVPAAVVQPASARVHSSGERGSCEIEFKVLALVQCADWPSAQDALDVFVSIGVTGSLIDALETAAGGSEQVTVTDWDGYGTTMVGENMYGTVTLNVTVWMSS